MVANPFFFGGMGLKGDGGSVIVGFQLINHAEDVGGLLYKLPTSSFGVTFGANNDRGGVAGETRSAGSLAHHFCADLGETVVIKFHDTAFLPGSARPARGMGLILRGMGVNAGWCR